MKITWYRNNSRNVIRSRPKQCKHSQTVSTFLFHHSLLQARYIRMLATLQFSLYYYPVLITSPYIILSKRNHMCDITSDATITNQVSRFWLSRYYYCFCDIRSEMLWPNETKVSRCWTRFVRIWSCSNKWNMTQFQSELIAKVTNDGRVSVHCGCSMRLYCILHRTGVLRYEGTACGRIGMCDIMHESSCGRNCDSVWEVRIGRGKSNVKRLTRSSSWTYRETSISLLY